MDTPQFLMPDKWLSKLMNKNTFSMDIHIAMQQSVDTIEKLFPKSDTFIFCKVPTSNISGSMFLEKLGFNIVDTNIQMKKKSNVDKRVIENTRYALIKDRSRIVEIAKNSFIFSRFHLDPNIDNNIANLIKEKWVDNYFNGERGNFLIVKEMHSIIVGFLLILQKKEDYIIDLIAVDSNYRKLGIARDMIVYFESNLGSEKTLITGTQIANIQSLRLYQSLGFKVNRSDYIFHYHS